MLSDTFAKLLCESISVEDISSAKGVNSDTKRLYDDGNEVCVVRQNMIAHELAGQKY